MPRSIQVLYDQREVLPLKFRLIVTQIPKTERQIDWTTNKSLVHVMKKYFGKGEHL